MGAAIATDEARRVRISIRGMVQGVGFRPFIYRLATEMHLPGWVSNTAQGVFIEVEGSEAELQSFIRRISAEKPAISSIHSLESSLLDPVGFTEFEIRPSDSSGATTAFVLPDTVVCPDCLRETLDPADRRYRYPFTNCTNCGPRFSIIEGLPYDRPATTMRAFKMCPACQREYDDPLDRRFHAQPNACPVCGPHLELWTPGGEVLATKDEALKAAGEAIRAGKVVAVKGIGGFQLMVDARNEAAVVLLRQRKRRDEKPFALMYPSLDAVKADCEVSDVEEGLLTSPASPIVLLHRRSEAAVAPSVAPGNPHLGVMIPYTPLHHLLMAEVGGPVVATSGNLSDEPICTDEHEALTRLAGIADLFLVHNRPIARHVDDSVARVVMGRELVMRRARGYAPLPVHLAEAVPSTLAVGAHLKNSVALAVGQDVFVSQHIGDLETEPAYEAFRRVTADLQRLYDTKPTIIACDAHPDYLSGRYADASGLPTVRVQHHLAHVLSCMAENELAGPALGVSWDGTGFGLDGTVWGGEFLHVTDDEVTRAAHFRPFRLIGGDRAVREPRRVGLAILVGLFGEELEGYGHLPAVAAFTAPELRAMLEMLARGLNSPLTSSVGRLFDAVASLVDSRQVVRFEGQAAMELEFALEGVTTDEAYRFEPLELPTAGLQLDWAPVMRAIISDAIGGVPVGEISAKFHNALVEAIVDVALITGEASVVLSGGCFQNKYLTERAVTRLRQEGFRPYWHQRVPPNDGGIALGQIAAAAHERKWRDVSRSSR
jgi:hydrogenase maturation protein HypF